MATDTKPSSPLHLSDLLPGWKAATSTREVQFILGQLYVSQVRLRVPSCQVEVCGQVVKIINIIVRH